MEVCCFAYRSHTNVMYRFFKCQKWKYASIKKDEGIPSEKEKWHIYKSYVILEAEIATMIKDKGTDSLKIILIMGFNTEIFHCFFTIGEEKHTPENFSESVDMNTNFFY